MPVFVNTNENYLIATSYKVMYGTLYQQSNLTLLAKKRVPFVLMRDKILFKKRTNYLLVRNPYDRLVSCFVHKIKMNKFQYKPLDSKTSNIRWQNCQTIFFPYFNINVDSDDYSIGKHLADISFENFIQALPHVFKKDAHLWPQSWAYYCRLRTYPVMHLKFDKIIRIEDEIEFLKDNLHIDIGIQENKTDHDFYSKYYTPYLYQIVNKIYENDFNYFGYQMQE